MRLHLVAQKAEVVIPLRFKAFAQPGHRHRAGAQMHEHVAQARHGRGDDEQVLFGNQCAQRFERTGANLQGCGQGYARQVARIAAAALHLRGLLRIARPQGHCVRGRSLGSIQSQSGSPGPGTQYKNVHIRPAGTRGKARKVQGHGEILARRAHGGGTPEVHHQTPRRDRSDRAKAVAERAFGFGSIRLSPPWSPGW